MSARPDVIDHPKEQPIAVIRLDYVTICEGNQCAAAILNLFEYWTWIKKQSNKQATIKNQIDAENGKEPTQDIELWIYKSQREMREELVLAWSENSIGTAVKYLIKKEFLRCRSNPNNKWDQTLQYLFEIDKVQEAVNQAYPAFRKFEESIPQKQGIDRSKKRNRIRKTTGSIPQKRGSNTKDYKTKTTSKVTAKTTPPPTPAAQPEPSEPDGANGGGGENVILNPIETLLAENGINPQSWKFAADWSPEQLQVIIDRSKEPGIERPAAWIVSQLKSRKAHAAAQLELETRKDAPPVEESETSLETLANAPSREMPKREIPPFEPIVRGWTKETSASETWRHGVLTSLQIQFHKATWNSWIEGSEVVAFEGNQEPPMLTICAKSVGAKDWLEQRMIQTVQGIAEHYFGTIALRIIAPADLDATLAAIRARLDTPKPESQTDSKPIFSKGVGWINRDGDDPQQSEQPEPRFELPQPPAERPSVRLTYDPAALSPALIWKKIKDGLKHTDLTRHQYDTYFEKADAVGHVENEIFVQVGAHAMREIQTHLKDKVNARISRVTKGCWRIRFVDRDDQERLPENLIRVQEAV